METNVLNNRIDNLFANKKEDIFSVFFTAGYPHKEDTVPIINALADSGADLIEIGIPFSDPLADGPTIQDSSMRALKNGMNLEVLFEQLTDIRKVTDIPLILMGYLNPVMQCGIERFCRKCADIGIDGVILPDLPIYEFAQSYKSVFQDNNLHNIFLISPQTPESRIRMIDENTHGFIYMVSSNSITGSRNEISGEQLAYFDRIKKMELSNPRLIGFGISNFESFKNACNYANGAIIGSAFIRALSESEDVSAAAHSFVKQVKYNQ